MRLFDHPEYAGHEQIVFCGDRKSGLRAIIAVHDTTLGPALGGCRMWRYGSEAEALTDALRLSKGMTYKAAMAGLPLGGGKSVIMGDAKTDKTPQLIDAFAEAVDRLNRRYITAEDVGTSVGDMDRMRKITPHVVGVTGEAGDPSNSTAHGVFIGIQAAVRHKLKREDLRGLRVTMQGAGHVGYFLCEYLAKAGAKVSVADIDRTRAERLAREFGATIADLNGIFELEADVFAPCALGGSLDDRSIPRLSAPIVAGSANNQLAEARHDTMLRDRGILYAPDYVINAGGLIDVARYAVGFDIEEGRRKLRLIDTTLSEIFQRSDAEGEPTQAIADRMAEERIAIVRGAQTGR